MKRLLLLFCALTLTIPLFAQNTVYISTGSGNQVLAFNTANKSSSALYTANGAIPEDSTYGPDGLLYVCDPTNHRIVRVNPSTSVATTIFQATTAPPLAPQGPRFTPNGDLVFNDKQTAALWIMRGVASGSTPAPQLLVSGTGIGGGIAFSNQGDLLFVAGSQVYRSSPPYSSAAVVFSGLQNPVGIARDDFNHFYVAVSNALKQCDLPVAGATLGVCTTYATFTDTPTYLEASSDKIWVATSDATNANGKLWLINQAVSSTPTLAFTVPKRKGVFPPATGLAITTTSKTITDAQSITVASTGTKKWNFGFEVAEIVPSTCKADLTSTQRLPADAAAQFASTLLNGQPVTFAIQPESGQEGFDRVITVTPKSGCTNNIDPLRLTVGNFITNPFGINPGLLRCDKQGNTNACSVLDMFGYWIFSGPLPDDAATSGRTKGFSDFVVADVTPTTAGINFGGVLSPFSPSATSPDTPAVFNFGQNITIKFHPTDANGANVPGLTAVLSVERIRPDIFRNVIFASGSSNAPPVFRYDANTGQYLFNLSSTELGVAPGEYAAHITAIGAFDVQTVYFCLDSCPVP